MKKVSDILQKCTQFEELASFGIEPISLEHPSIPRAPLVPMEFRPTELVHPNTIPASQWDTTPTDRRPSTPTLRSPVLEQPVVTPTPEVRPPVVEKPPVTPTPEVKPPVVEEPGIKSSDIKFDKDGKVVLPKEWFNEQGKLIVDKQQLAKAIYDAQRTKIVTDKVDAARAKVMAKEMSQVSSMVKSIAFKEKLPARATIALLSAAALTAAYVTFSGGKKPQTNDPVKKEVVQAASTGVTGGTWQQPTPVDMSATIQDLKDALQFVRARTPKEKQVIQGYMTMLTNVNASIGKLSGSTLDLDTTSSAASFAAQVTNFDKQAVDAVSKLQKLDAVLKARYDASGSQKTEKVIDGLQAYVVAINNARTVRTG
jgi:hypothetical protein